VYEEAGNARVYTIEDTEEPHPDLKTTLFKLKPFLAETHHLDKEKHEYVAPTGFKLSGEDGTICIITGTLITPSGKVVAINSDAIDLSGESYSFLDKLTKVIELLTQEAEAFFFDGKVAQGKLPFNEEKGNDTVID
jgi:hypothetical protein